jgi:hypothetical protein
MPRSQVAGAYDRELSVTDRSGAEAYFFRSLRISRLRWMNIENLALGIDGGAIDKPSAPRFQIDFVKIPNRMRFLTAPSQMRGRHWPEVVHPAAQGLVREREFRGSERGYSWRSPKCLGARKLIISALIDDLIDYRRLAM